jgi:hypothetical protein
LFGIVVYINLSAIPVLLLYQSMVNITPEIIKGDVKAAVLECVANLRVPAPGKDTFLAVYLTTTNGHHLLGGCEIHDLKISGQDLVTVFQGRFIYFCRFFLGKSPQNCNPTEF